MSELKVHFKTELDWALGTECGRLLTSRMRTTNNWSMVTCKDCLAQML